MEQGRTYPNQSDQVNELFEALSKLHKEVRNIPKTKKGQSGNRFYMYADFPDVLDMVREKLADQGLCIIQTPVRSAEKTVLQTILGHKSGQWIRGEIPINVSELDPKSMGAYITYYRRYSMMAILALEDEDNENELPEPKKEAECASDAQKISPAQLTNIKNLLNGDETIASKILKDIRLLS